MYTKEDIENSWIFKTTIKYLSKEFPFIVGGELEGDEPYKYSSLIFIRLFIDVDLLIETLPEQLRSEAKPFGGGSATSLYILIGPSKLWEELKVALKEIQQDIKEQTKYISTLSSIPDELRQPLKDKLFSPIEFVPHQIKLSTLTSG
jgi:hypothetical protein